MDKKQGAFYQYLVFFMIIVCLFLLISCSTKQAVVRHEEVAAPKKEEPTQKQEITYRRIILNKFEADSNLAKSRPDAAILCENATLHELLHIGTVPIIVKAASKSLKDTDTTIVKVRLTYVQAGADPARSKKPASKARMKAHVRLIDASTGKLIGEKNVSLADNAPTVSSVIAPQLGKLVAQYVSQTLQSPITTPAP